MSTQFTGTIPATSSSRFFTFNWAAWQQVAWTVMPTTINIVNTHLNWHVAVQRAAGAFVTYWINVTNGTNALVSFEVRYVILGRWQ